MGNLLKNYFWSNCRAPLRYRFKRRYQVVHRATEVVAAQASRGPDDAVADAAEAAEQLASAVDRVGQRVRNLADDIGVDGEVGGAGVLNVGQEVAELVGCHRRRRRSCCCRRRILSLVPGQLSSFTRFNREID